MKMQREFNLISGKKDYQYISKISKGIPVGYDKDEIHAIELTDQQVKKIVKYFEYLKVKFNVIKDKGFENETSN